MRAKDEILSALMGYAADLPPEHKQLALVAIVETEVQIDIRDILEKRLSERKSLVFDISQKD